MNHPIKKYFFRYAGIILLLATFIFYYELTEFEERGGSYRSNILIIWLYESIGKWGVILTLFAASGGWFFLSIRHYLLKKNGKVVDGKNPRGMNNMWC